MHLWALPLHMSGNAPGPRWIPRVGETECPQGGGILAIDSCPFCKSCHICGQSNEREGSYLGEPRSPLPVPAPAMGARLTEATACVLVGSAPQRGRASAADVGWSLTQAHNIWAIAAGVDRCVVPRRAHRIPLVWSLAVLQDAPLQEESMRGAPQMATLQLPLVSLNP